jgi:hypothetical protein
VIGAKGKQNEIKRYLPEKRFDTSSGTMKAMFNSPSEQGEAA